MKSTLLHAWKPRALMVVAFVIWGFVKIYGDRESFSSSFRSNVQEGLFESDVRPLLETYCMPCHSAEERKGDLDLDRLDSLAYAERHPSLLQSIARRLEDDEMPPSGKPKPTAQEKANWLQWANTELDKLATDLEGDPGPVILRRLSNAEYAYTVRDITGLVFLDPTRDLPGENLAGEGFANAGQAMVMSPDLFEKYMSIAREIASHAIFLPGGIRFSVRTTESGWTDEILGQIRALYAEYTEAREVAFVDAQGNRSRTTGARRIPLQRYFAATLAERDALEGGSKSLDTVAGEKKLSPKYLTLLWSALHQQGDTSSLDRFCARWRSATSDAAKSLAAEVESFGANHWRFNDLITIRKSGGAKQWQESVSPLAQEDEAFRSLFPAALCSTAFVKCATPWQCYREDDQLARLVLDKSRSSKLDQLWEELHFVNCDGLDHRDDRDPNADSIELEDVVDFAKLAYRRPLHGDEEDALRALYHQLRAQGAGHDEAVRLTLARVFVAPAFLYRLESPPQGVAQAPVSDWELASRLSYFLWSSAPDADLCESARAGKLHETGELLRQTRRMLCDLRIRRLAIEFGCTWLRIRDFDQMNEKSDRQFPHFRAMRSEMYEESVRFLTDLFQSNRPVRDLLGADDTFLDESLAAFYGIPGVTGPEWRRVDGVRKYFRGGVLAQAAVLANRSTPSRTSPILRGDWIAETLLGERIPQPPKDVPSLPEIEPPDGLSVHQLTERHASDPRCASCHDRFDGLGLALENFDVIGCWRQIDSAGRPIDASGKAKDGRRLDGYAGLSIYLSTERRGDFERQFCRKLLGFALGRSVQFSDESLLRKIEIRLQSDDRAGSIVETIVTSRQFREIRGRDAAFDE